MVYAALTGDSKYISEKKNRMSIKARWKSPQWPRPEQIRQHFIIPQNMKCISFFILLFIDYIALCHTVS